jgi:hypothetical protein
MRLPSGSSSTASWATGIRRGDSLSTVDSIDGGTCSSETSGSFKVSAEGARSGDQASAALLEASARRLANSSTTVGSDQIVERLRNLERKIPPRPGGGGREGQQVR